MKVGAEGRSSQRAGVAIPTTCRAACCLILSRKGIQPRAPCASAGRSERDAVQRQLPVELGRENE